MSQLNFQSVIFDLDGVITKTATTHSRAWKTIFDEYLISREKKFGEKFREFNYNKDYLPYVDGKPRYEGVASLLSSRGIDIPRGDPHDSPDKETICGLGNKKNQKFIEIIEKDGVQIYKSTLNLIKKLKRRGVRLGVASSSKSCRKILEIMGLLEMFDTCVGGIVSEERQLQGKPQPDIFTTACDNMGSSYYWSVVVEDSVSGVRAGKAGNFCMVIGIDRANNGRKLKIHGADIVVKDLSDLNIETIVKWFKEGLPEDQWYLDYYHYDPEQEKTRESLCTIGNGYFGTRGAWPELSPYSHHYPGTYVAGIYNKLETNIQDKNIVNEDLVNFPNWLLFKFRIANAPWVNLDDVEILRYHSRLNLKSGIFSREIIINDKKGRKTKIYTERLASKREPHAAAQKYSITPLNHTSVFTIQTGIKDNVINNGVDRYKQLNDKHLKLLSKGFEEGLINVAVETNQSHIKIAESAKILIYQNNSKLSTPLTTIKDQDSIAVQFEKSVAEGNKLDIEKLVTIYTSNDKGVNFPSEDARKAVAKLACYTDMKTENMKAWKSDWSKSDIKVTGDRLTQKILRLHIYHLIITRKIDNYRVDWGIPARGLHGEAYRGHIFWDELFCLPFFNLHFPKTARSILKYRYRRLSQAKIAANKEGYQGALFPWQSASDGSETTQRIHLNPISGEWGDDNSHLQKHVSLAIAYNIWQYYHMTEDIDFLTKYGAEIFFEISRFLASKAEYDSKLEKYVINNVMGPDEFHEKYPNSSEAGFNNNSYTNIMTAWVLKKASILRRELPDNDFNKISNDLNLEGNDFSRWEKISNNLQIPTSADSIIAQFEGFFSLKKLDIEKFKAINKNIKRMDRILKAAGDTPNNYQILKQADLLMIFYLLSESEYIEIMSELNINTNVDLLRKNFDYYFPKTTHGSTLSPIVHSSLAHKLGYKELSWKLFTNALLSDYQDLQGGTTKEGIHTGVMAATLMEVLQSYAGLDFSKNILYINPDLPEHWENIQFQIIFKKTQYNFSIFPEYLQVLVKKEHSRFVNINVDGEKIKVPTEKALSIKFLEKE